MIKRVRLKITFQYDTEDGGHEAAELTKIVSTDDSVRRLAFSFIQEVINEGKIFWSPHLDDNTPLAVYVASEDVTDIASGFKAYGFGIKYALRDNGSLVILDGYSPLLHDWKVSEILELVDSGYIKGDKNNHLIIGLPTGLGAGPEDVFDWLGFLANLTQLTGLAYNVARRIGVSFVSRKPRLIAKKWKAQGIRYPEQLREFIDTKAEWKLSDLKRRLQLDDEYTIKLLVALGFEVRGNFWRISQSKSAVGRRKRWLQNERRYRTSKRI